MFRNKKKKKKNKKDKKSKKEKKGKKEEDDDDVVEVSDVEAKEENATSVNGEWWSTMLSADDKLKYELSGKLVLLAEALRMCHEIGDKM